MGVTMYEMAMSGEMPFRESEDPDMRVTVASKAIVGYRDFAMKKYEPKFDAFVRNLLKKDLTKRVGPKENNEYFSSFETYFGWCPYFL